MSNKMSRRFGLGSSVGMWLLAGAVFGLGGCGTAASEDESDRVASTNEAVTAATTPMPTDGSLWFKVNRRRVDTSRRRGCSPRFASPHRDAIHPWASRL